MKTIPIGFYGSNDIEYKDIPVSVSIPFAKGVLKETNKLAILNANGELVPLQAKPLSLWSDKSIKWLFLDFFASISSVSVDKFSLVECNEVPEQKQFITTVIKDNFISVDTGSATFFIGKDKSWPFNKVVKNGVDIINGSLSAMVLIDENGSPHETVIDNIGIETNGKITTTVRVDGCFKIGGKSSISFFSRIQFYYLKSFVKISFTIRNPDPVKHSEGLWDIGDKGSFLFKGLSFNLSPVTGTQNSIHYKSDRDSEVKRVKSNSISIYQDSSGGENWKSANHINRSNEIPVKFRGYKVYDNEKVIEEGGRASPFIYIGDNKNGLSACIDKFWQNFPKELSVKGDTLNVSLFPKRFSGSHELQGGEQKSHTIFLDFSGEPAALNCVNNPLIPFVSSDVYKDSKAFPYFSVNSDAIYDALIETAVSGDNSFIKRREIIDEYGWRNFGEVYADHEAIYHKGATPLVSHYNNQYDPIYSTIRQFAVQGDFSWYELMDDLVRHVIDIDIYHTDKDRDEFNGGLFWHTNHYLDVATSTHRTYSREHEKVKPGAIGGGPSLEHLYSTGLLYHYYLTGNPQSYEAVFGLADWALNVIDQPRTFLGALLSLKMKKVLWGEIKKGNRIRADIFPFTRGSGNAITALLDAFSLEGSELYLRKAEEIIRGCIHPEDDIESRDLLNAEICWSYNVCLQAVGKYLDVKAEKGEFDDMYYYARSSLLHYAKWMLKYEYPYLEKIEILEYPNETWPAQDMRKSCVFCYAAKYSYGDIRNSFLEKADYFYRYSVNKLSEFETKTLARPVVLMLQNGWMYGYFRANPECAALQTDGEWKVTGREDEFWTRALILKRAVKDILKGVKITNIQKEIKWMLCRLNRHT